MPSCLPEPIDVALFRLRLHSVDMGVGENSDTNGLLFSGRPARIAPKREQMTSVLSERRDERFRLRKTVTGRLRSPVSYASRAGPNGRCKPVEASAEDGPPLCTGRVGLGAQTRPS